MLLAPNSVPEIQPLSPDVACSNCGTKRLISPSSPPVDPFHCATIALKSSNRFRAGE